MSTVLDPTASLAFDLHSEKIWTELINIMRPYVRYLVYSAHVTFWRGQEEDIIEDIVQETARRVIDYSQRAERGEVLPIHSPKHIIMLIARNYCIDMQRQDRRLQPLLSDNYTTGNFPKGEHMSPLEIATEHVYREEVFTRLAREIAHFPTRQRRALLIDLANRMHFDIELTSLQKAFLKEGVDLKTYQLPLPKNAKERTRHAALLSLAYKRIAKSMSEYTL